MAQTLTPEHVKFLQDNGLRRVLRRDPTLPHQIVLTWCGNGSAHMIGISCNCLRTRGDGKVQSSSSHDLIEARPCWQPGEAIARWRQHVAEAEAAS